MTNKNLFTIIFYEQLLNNILNDVSIIILVLAILEHIQLLACCYIIYCFDTNHIYNCQEISWKLYLRLKVTFRTRYLQNKMSKNMSPETVRGLPLVWHQKLAESRESLLACVSTCNLI